jgi:hypothetical protein
LTFAVRAKLKQLVVNFRRKSATPAAAVCQKVIEISRQANVVLPQAGDRIRNPRKPLKQSQRLDLRRKACHPSQRNRKLLVEWLRPSPVSGI